MKHVYRTIIHLMTEVERTIPQKNLSVMDQRIWISSRKAIADLVYKTSIRGKRATSQRRLRFLHGLGFVIQGSIVSLLASLRNLFFFRTCPSSKDHFLVFDLSSSLVQKGSGLESRILSEKDHARNDLLFMEVTYPLGKAFLSLLHPRRKTYFFSRGFLRFLFFWLRKPLSPELGEFSSKFSAKLREKLKISVDATAIHRLLTIHQAGFLSSLARLQRSARIREIVRNANNPIFVYCYYSSVQQALIHFAQLHQKTLAELQHGMISDEHPGYALEENSFHEQIFPQKMYLFGEDWSQFFTLMKPFARREVVIFGNENSLVKRVVLQGRRNILVSSQGELEDDFHHFVFDFVSAREPGEKVYLKAHPGDQSKRIRFFKKLARDFDHVKYVAPNVEIVRLMASEIDYHLAVYSTSICQANMLGIPNMIPKGIHFSDRAQLFVELELAVYIQSDVSLKNVAPQNQMNLFSPYRTPFHP